LLLDYLKLVDLITGQKISYFYPIFIKSCSPQNWGVRGQEVDSVNPKTSCPHPQSLSQHWERAEKYIKNIDR
jgi:hypothetical protein